MISRRRWLMMSVVFEMGDVLRVFFVERKRRESEEGAEESK
jgi:hypothetical protein